LKHIAKPAPDILDDDSKQMLKDLWDTFNDHIHEAAGLSATQIELDIAAFIAKINYNQPTLFINPYIAQESSWQVEDKEGCLSLPGVRLYITRPRIITLVYQTLKEDGNGLTEPVRKTFKGADARVIQHEKQHLLGKLIIDELSMRIGNTFIPNPEPLEPTKYSKQKTKEIKWSVTKTSKAR